LTIVNVILTNITVYFIRDAATVIDYQFNSVQNNIVIEVGLAAVTAYAMREGAKQRELEREKEREQRELEREKEREQKERKDRWRGKRIESLRGRCDSTDGLTTSCRLSL